MIGPRARSLLRRLAKAGARRSLAGSLGLWILLALAATNLLSAAGLLGWIDRPVHDGLLILLLSTFPLALFYPPDPRSGKIALRAVDRGAVLESALAAGSQDAAEPLLRRAGEELAASLGRVSPERRRLSRGARRVCLAAGFVILVSQGAFVLVAGGPVFGYAARFAREGRAEEGSAAFSRPESAEGAGGPSDAEPEGIPDTVPGARGENLAERADREAEFADLHGLLRRGREGSAADARSQGGPEGGEEPETPRTLSRSDGIPGEPSGSSGRAGTGEGEAPGSEGPGEGGQPRGSAGGDRNRGPGSGWSESPGASLGRNAMKDYRAAFEKVLTERTGAAVTAGAELSLAETEAALSLYFESRILRVDVEPDEDPVAASLRSAWQRLRGEAR